MTNEPLNDHVQICVIAESFMAALPDDATGAQVQTIMTVLSPQRILAELHALGYKIVRAD